MKNNKGNYAGTQLESVYRKYAAMDVEGVLSAFDCTEAGLSAQTAQERLEKYGPNQVHSTKAVPWYMFLFKSFLDEFILVLLFLSIISFFLNDRLGAGIIFLLLILLLYAIAIEAVKRIYIRKNGEWL